MRERLTDKLLFIQLIGQWTLFCHLRVYVRQVKSKPNPKSDFKQVEKKTGGPLPEKSAYFEISPYNER